MNPTTLQMQRKCARNVRLFRYLWIGLALSLVWWIWGARHAPLWVYLPVMFAFLYAIVKSMRWSCRWVERYQQVIHTCPPN